MRCCVPSCKNDSKNISKSQGITFHVFPNNPSLRTAWHKAIGKKTWEPKERSSVCSEHFLWDDLYETKSGLRKVRAGAVPLVVQDSANRDAEPVTYKACRICLVMDAKLIPIRFYKLEQAYKNLTGLSLCENDKLPEKLCMECVQRLLNFSRFRHKGLRANTLMLELIKKQNCLTVKNIKTINRENYKLESSLSLKHYETDHYDAYIEFTEPPPAITSDTSPHQTPPHNTIPDFTCDVEIKRENEIFFKEEIESNHTNDAIHEDMENNHTNDIFHEDIENNHTNDIFHEDMENNHTNDVTHEDMENDHTNDVFLQDMENNHTNDVFLKDMENNHTNDVIHDGMENNQTKDVIDEDMENDHTNDVIDEDMENNHTNDVIHEDMENNHTNDVTHEDMENNHTNDVIDDGTSDKEYLASDKDYSSDDNIPLNRCKTKKVKKRKEKVKKRVKKVKKLKSPVEPKIDRRRKPFLNDDLNETLFTITDLTYEEQIAEIFKRQESANYKNAVFKCTSCFKGFLDEDAYNTHVTRHTDQCGEHECSICKTHFKHPHALRKHITAHHTQRFSCNQCTYMTTHRQTARLHERWHKGTKYRCPHCQDEFVKFTTYMGHIRIKHPSDFVCELCGYSFVSAKGIELHKKLKHRLENSQIPDDGPLCEVCNVRFVSSEAHRRHLSVSARHNTGTDKDSRESNKPKKGRKKKESKENDRIAREKDKESDEKRRIYPSQMRKAEGPIPCEQCGLQLEDSRAYHGHFRRMHPDKNRTNYPSMKSPCMCEVCGRMFQSYALLKDHTWVHTGERPFKCECCGKAFRMKQRLVAHRRVHSQERVSYVCNLCGKHFSTHSNRQRHMFIHTGLKPFKCEMCGKGFKHASEKRAHITYVHLKKPWPKRARGKRRPDTRQGQLQPQGGSNAMDIAPPMWPACDPKMGDIGPMMQDKPVYYNLKI